MTLRRFRFTSTYEDGEEFVCEHDLDFDNDRAEDEDYLYDVLFPLTGVGRSGDAFYEVESIDDLEPMVRTDWGG